MRAVLLALVSCAACSSVADSLGIGGQCGFSDSVVLPGSDAIGSCARSGWCWRSPSPQGNDLRAIWGTSKSDLWAAGDAGTLLHFDGTGWSPVDLQTTVRLHALWGSGARDVWLAGDAGTLFHFDGTSWSPAMLPTGGDVRALHGFATDDVWAAGVGKDPAGLPRPLLFHYDGMRWTAAAAATTARLELTDLWGAAPGDVWATGTITAEGRNGLLHWDGRAWNEVAIDERWLPTRVSGSGARDVWAVGEARTLIHWDGAKWSATTGEDISENERFLDVWAPAAGEAFALSFGGHIYRWRGEAWSLETRTMSLVPEPLADLHPGPSAVWRAPDGELFAAGRQGVVARGEGDDWTRSGAGWNLGLAAVWGSGEKDVWIAGDARSTSEGPGPFLHHNGDTLTRPRCAPIREIRALWGLASDRAWALDRDQHLHAYNGAGWAEEKHGLAGEGVQLFTGFATSPNDLWIAGTIFGHWNGNTWREVPAPALTTPLHVESISGVAPDDLWAAGDPRAAGRRTQVLHFDGTSWTDWSPRLPITAVASTVWARAKDDVWLGGFDLSLMGPIAATWRWDGTTWTRVETPAELVTVRAIHGRAADDVWAVGSAGNAARWDGTRWTRVHTGAADELIGVWAGPEATWAIGGASILRRPK